MGTLWTACPPRRAPTVAMCLRVVGLAVGMLLLSAATTPAVARAGDALGVAAAPPPTTQVVATGAAKAFGEAVATGSDVPVVAATRFGGDAVVQTWMRAATGWRPGPALLPAGTATSYDAAAAVLPDGTSLLVFGAAPAGACIAGGEVALARVSAAGAVGAPQVINTPTTGFDDRPTVAAGSGGAVWAGWSHGPSGEQCQPVGTQDVIQLARSTDGGRTFGPVRTLPSVTGGAAFGVRIVVQPDGAAVVSWVESTPTTSALVVGEVNGSGVLVRPHVVDTGPRAPLVLPGASFYAFTTPALAVLPDGRVVAAWPRWTGASSELRVLVGRSGGGFTALSVPAPAGSDVLMPAVVVAGRRAVWCLYAVHQRADDALGYQLATVSVGASGPQATAVRTVAGGSAGPGYFELGEETQLSAWSGRLRSAVVLAGAAGSSVVWWRWPLSGAVATPSASRSPVAPSSLRPGSRRRGRAPVSGRASAPWAVIAAAAAGLVTVAVLLRRRALLRRRR